jgi:tRNA A37 threonylcarbamoyladenosine synthetase subunit TsaC/SUA5/YrdC
VRVPALALPRDLAREAGPLVSTSANAAGAAAPVTCAEAVRAVGGAVALALDAGPGRPAASTIVALSAEGPRLLRAGAVEWERVLEVLR